MSRLFLFVLCITVLLLGYGTQLGTAQKPIEDDGQSYDLAEVVPTGSENWLETSNGNLTYSVAVQNNYAYFSVGPYLLSAEISHPIRPFLTGKSPELPGVVQSVAVRGNYAYLATGTGGLRIMDIHRPTLLTEVSAVEARVTANSLVVTDKYVYVADGGVRVINVENPLMPQEVGFLETNGQARDIALSGNRLYFADGSAGFRIIDVTEPSAPTLLGVYETSRNALQVTVAGQYAYLTGYFRSSGNSMLHIIDVKDPTRPTQVGTYATEQQVHDLAIVGHYAYLAEGENGIRLLNISSPANPTEVALYDTPGTAWGLTVSDDYAYVADGHERLTIVQITDALYQISGKVNDEKGNPLADVTISVAPENSSITDKAGHYRFNVPFGRYRLTAQKSGYLFAPRTITVPPDLAEQNFTATLPTNLVYLPLIAHPDMPTNWIEGVARGAIGLGQYQLALGGPRFSPDTEWIVEYHYNNSLSLSRWNWTTFREEPSHSIPLTGNLAGRFSSLIHRYYSRFYENNLTWHPAGIDIAAITSSEPSSLARSVQIWNRATGEEIESFTYPDDSDSESWAVPSISNVDYSPDGRWLAVATGTQVHIYDAITRQPIHTLNHELNTYHLSFSPNGEWLVTSQADTVPSDDTCCYRVGTFHLWHVPTAHEVMQLIDEPITIDFRHVVFASDSQHLTIPFLNKVWNVSKVKPVLELGENGVDYLSTFSPNGRFFAFRETDFKARSVSVVVWDTSTRQEITRIPVDVVPQALRFSPDSQKLVTSGVRSIIDQATSTEIGRVSATDIWNPITGQSLLQLDFGEAPISSDVWQAVHHISVGELSFSANGNWLLTGDKGGGIRVWNAKTGEQMFQVEYDQDHDPSSYLYHFWAEFAPNGMGIMAYGPDGSKVWYPALTGLSASSSVFR